jgi:hypothetical protein
MHVVIGERQRFGERRKPPSVEWLPVFGNHNPQAVVQQTEQR